MAPVITHLKVSPKLDGPDPTQIRPSDWNASHVVTGSGWFVPGMVVDYVGHSIPTGFLEAYGQSVAAASYPNLYAAMVKSATVTFTSGTPGVVNWAAHGLPINSKVRFRNSGGSLPAAITANVDYYILTAGYTANSFRISATLGGVEIAFATGGSGTHTGLNAQFGVSTDLLTFTVPDMRGYVTAGLDTMGGSAAGRLTGLSGGVSGIVLGAVGGEQAHILTLAEEAAHTHLNNPPDPTVSFSGFTVTVNAGGAHTPAGTLDSQGTHTHAGSTADSGGSHTHTVNTATGVTGSGGAFTPAGSIVSGGSHSHTVTGTVDSGGAHTHTVTGTVTTTNHTHSISFNSQNNSQNHLHHTSLAHKSITGTSMSGGGSTDVYIASGANDGSNSLNTDTNNVDHFHVVSGTTASGGGQTVSLASGVAASGGAHTHTFSSGATSTDGSHTHTFNGTAVAAHTHTVAIDSGGAHTHTLTIANAGAHTHTFTGTAVAAHTHTTTLGGTITSAQADFATGSAGGGGAHNNIQPTVVVRKLIYVA